MRWAEWLRHPDYPATLGGFARAHELSAVLREAVADDIDEFYRRRRRAPSLVEQEHSRDYLLEELAVITLQARSLPSVKLYPGGELRCLHVVRHGEVPDAPRGLEREQFARIKIEAREPSPALLPGQRTP